MRKRLKPRQVIYKLDRSWNSWSIYVYDTVFPERLVQFSQTLSRHTYFSSYLWQSKIYQETRGYEETKTQRRASIDVNLLKRPVSCAASLYQKQKYFTQTDQACENSSWYVSE